MPDPYMFDNSTNLCKMRANSTLNPRGPNLPNPPNNPVIYLSPKMYDVDIGLDSPNNFVINLKNLKNAQQFDKQKYIQSMVDKKVIQPYVWSLARVNNTNDTKTTRVKDIKFTPVDNMGALWSEGKILFKMESEDRERIEGVIRLSAPDFVKRLLEEDTPQALKKGGPVVARTKSASELWKPDGISQLKKLPAYKETPEFLENTFEVLFGLLKIVILCL